MSVAAPLAGRRVLIVEDRYLIASEMAEEVRRLGGEVLGPSPNVAAAVAIIDREAIDVALLDVNLDGELVFPLADALAQKGVPFIFMTGYERDTLPAAWRDRPSLSKPLDPRALRARLIEAAAPPA